MTQNDPIRPVLEELDLNEKEIAIYLMLLRLGTATASALGDRTGIVRSTAQYTCQQLAKKGLARMVQKGNAYLFSAEDPRRLFSLLERQRRQLDRKEEDVHRIIGTLTSLMNPQTVLPKVRFFEGKDGILEGYRIVIESVGHGEEILSYLHALEKAEDEFDLSKEFADITSAIHNKGIINRTISPRSPYALAWQKQDSPPQIQTRLTEESPDLTPTEIMIFGDSLYAMSVERHQLFGYLVQNAAMAHMHRAMFEALWSRLA